jgi:hypothetical protein
MRNIARGTLAVSPPRRVPGRLAIWNRRLLMVAAVLILWAASILALNMAGPDAQALLAGEGMLINPVEQK